MTKKVRKVVIPAAGPHKIFFILKAYSLESRYQIYGAIPAFSINKVGGLIYG